MLTGTGTGTGLAYISQREGEGEGQGGGDGMDRVKAYNLPPPPPPPPPRLDAQSFDLSELLDAPLGSSLSLAPGSVGVYSGNMNMSLNLNSISCSFDGGGAGGGMSMPFGLRSGSVGLELGPSGTRWLDDPEAQVSVCAPPLFPAPLPSAHLCGDQPCGPTSGGH